MDFACHSKQITQAMVALFEKAEAREQRSAGAGGGGGGVVATSTAMRSRM